MGARAQRRNNRRTQRARRRGHQGAPARGGRRRRGRGWTPGRFPTSLLQALVDAGWHSAVSPPASDGPCLSSSPAGEAAAGAGKSCASKARCVPLRCRKDRRGPSRCVVTRAGRGAIRHRAGDRVSDRLHDASTVEFHRRVIRFVQPGRALDGLTVCTMPKRIWSDIVR
jgi:hypothetical protein